MFEEIVLQALTAVVVVGFSFFAIAGNAMKQRLEADGEVLGAPQAGELAPAEEPARMLQAA